MVEFGGAASMRRVEREFREEMAARAEELVDALRSEQSLAGRLRACAGEVTITMKGGCEVRGAVLAAWPTAFALCAAAEHWWIAHRAVATIEGAAQVGPPGRAEPPDQPHGTALRRWVQVQRELLDGDVRVEYPTGGAHGSVAGRGWITAVGSDHLDIAGAAGNVMIPIASLAWLRCRPPRGHDRATCRSNA